MSRHSSVQRENVFTRDGLHLTGNGAAVCGTESARAFDESTSTGNFFNSPVQIDDDPDI